MIPFEETWHRLRERPHPQVASERLAALILAEEGFQSMDPSHPLGGRDRGADAVCQKDGQPWVMAVYFPRGQQTLKVIKDKLLHDIEAARHRNPFGIAFVTNQELTLGQREELRKTGGDIVIELYHLERITHILDRPHMAQVREQFLDIAAGPPPMLIKAEVIGAARYFIGGEELLNGFAEQEETELRERADELRQNPPNALDLHRTAAVMRIMGYDNVSGDPPKPLSENEIRERVGRYRIQLEGRWEACEDYLASHAWPALRFRITNQARSFLTNVQVILTFHGARGIEWLPPQVFEVQKLDNPDWEPPFDPAMIGVYQPAAFHAAPPADYPVEWTHNDEGDLEVTITLRELRPHPAWRDEGDDMVLVLRDKGLDAVTATYTATALGYGDVFEGEAFSVVVEPVDIFDSIHFAREAAREGF